MQTPIKSQGLDADQTSNNNSISTPGLIKEDSSYRGSQLSMKKSSNN